MLKFFIFILLIFSFLGYQNNANAYQKNYIEQYVTNHKPVGSGRLVYMFWDVYDATLYASGGKMVKGKPFALTLNYLRDIEGADIAGISAKEMQKQGVNSDADIKNWLYQMVNIFPSVKKGSIITGIYIPQKGTKFFYNGKLIGQIKSEEFSQSFFNIWLGPKSSKPQLRRSLTGVK